MSHWSKAVRASCMLCLELSAFKMGKSDRTHHVCMLYVKSCACKKRKNEWTWKDRGMSHSTWLPPITLVSD